MSEEHPTIGSTALAADTEFLRHLIDNTPDPIVVKDERHRWVFVNESFCRLVGYRAHELLGRRARDVFPAEQAAIFEAMDRQVFTTGAPVENEEEITGARGEVHAISTKRSLLVDGQGRRLLVGVIRDLTEKKKLEARLHVADRLTSLGTLAAGIAHEINNPLAYVIANIDYVCEQLAAGAVPADEELELEAALRTARDGAERVKTIVQGLASLSFFGTEKVEVIDVRTVLRSTVQLAGTDVRRCARLVEDYGALPRVDADQGRLGQVFLNLLINAVQAIEAREGGEHEIRVSTYTARGGEAVVEIADTGVGIRPEHLNRIFDPFFTTRSVGMSTGLGLSISHTIIDALNGQIEVESTPGQGSTFRVVLPASKYRPPKKTPLSSKAVTPAAAT